MAPTKVDRRCWRMLSPRWASEPLSGAGAKARGGRWNAREQPTLYLSEDHATAIAEYLQDLIRPGLLAPYEVRAENVVDLTTAAKRRQLGIDDTLLQLDWRRTRDVDRQRPVSWEFSEAAIDVGYVGLRVPSARTRGVNLILWHWNTPGGADVTCIDPQADLPRDQSSWT